MHIICAAYEGGKIVIKGGGRLIPPLVLHVCRKTLTTLIFKTLLDRDIRVVLCCVRLQSTLFSATLIVAMYSIIKLLSGNEHG